MIPRFRGARIRGARKRAPRRVDAEAIAAIAAITAPAAGTAAAAIAAVVAAVVAAAPAKADGVYLGAHLNIGFSDAAAPRLDGVDGEFREATDEGRYQLNVGAGAAIGIELTFFGAPQRFDASVNWHFRHDLDGDLVTASGVPADYKNNIETIDGALTFPAGRHFGDGGWNIYYDDGLFRRTLSLKRSAGYRRELGPNREDLGHETTNYTVQGPLAGLNRATLVAPISSRFALTLGYRAVNAGPLSTGPFSDGSALNAAMLRIRDLAVGFEFRL